MSESWEEKAVRGKPDDDIRNVGWREFDKEAERQLIRGGMGVGPGPLARLGLARRPRRAKRDPEK